MWKGNQSKMEKPQIVFDIIEIHKYISPQFSDINESDTSTLNLL